MTRIGQNVKKAMQAIDDAGLILIESIESDDGHVSKERYGFPDGIIAQRQLFELGSVKFNAWVENMTMSQPAYVIVWDEYLGN